MGGYIQDWLDPVVPTLPVNIFVVPGSEFPNVPSYPHYPHVETVQVLLVNKDTHHP